MSKGAPHYTQWLKGSKKAQAREGYQSRHVQECEGVRIFQDPTRTFFDDATVSRTAGGHETLPCRERDVLS